MKQSKPEYMEKVSALNEEGLDRLSSRMKGLLLKKLNKERISMEEALALQMELEDEQLEEWRKNVKTLRDKADENRFSRHEIS